MDTTTLSNKHLVALALYDLGGAERAIDTEDIAMRVSQIAPGRFRWKKYPEQIDLEAVRLAVKDLARGEQPLVSGGMRNGWMLTTEGLAWYARTGGAGVSVGRSSQTDSVGNQGNTSALRQTEAYRKFRNCHRDEITVYDLRRFLRIDEYTSVRRRKERIQAVLNAAAGDNELLGLIEHLRASFPEEWE